MQSPLTGKDHRRIGRALFRAWTIHSKWTICVKYAYPDFTAKHLPLCHCRNIMSAIADLGAAMHKGDRETALGIANAILSEWRVPKAKHWRDRRTDLPSFYDYAYYTPDYWADLDND